MSAVNVWYGILAPRDTPSDIVTTLYAAVNRTLTEPKVVARFAEGGGIPMTMSRDELAKFLADDLAKWHKIAEFAGIKSMHQRPRLGMRQVLLSSGVSA
jgi:tripartite-type tricarboxylate transporter receptor subunit TctC